MKEKNAKILRKEFNKKDKVWRIEAVIHDGNWYDVNKWKRVAKVSEEEIYAWINDNEDILIKSDLDSYRVNYDEIVKWYKNKGLNLNDSIIPNNFPPKLWGGITEADVFINAPRRRVGTVSFYAQNDDLLKKCTGILKGLGKIMPDIGGRHRAYGLSAIHMRNLLSKGLSTSEFDSLDVKTRAMLLQRELVDLPEEWLDPAINFYTNIFAPGILRSSMSTISIYLPDEGDVKSQTIIWIIAAMKKFDEKGSVPFSGYLSKVLRHWPYDLPDEFLGKSLSKFQRERKKAINTVMSKENNHDENIPIAELAEIMDMPIENYIELNNEHENWLAEKNATTLTWEDSSNEKKGDLLISNSEINIDTNKMFNISLAVIKAAIDTEDWESAYQIIYQMDNNDIDENIKSKLSSMFIKSFAGYLGNMTREH